VGVMMDGQGADAAMLQRNTSWHRYCSLRAGASSGHKDVRTTMIYTYIIDHGPPGVISPLDR
jgi:hypothetical protein